MSVSESEASSASASASASGSASENESFAGTTTLASSDGSSVQNSSADNSSADNSSADNSSADNSSEENQSVDLSSNNDDDDRKKPPLEKKGEIRGAQSRGFSGSFLPGASKSGKGGAGDRNGPKTEQNATERQLAENRAERERKMNAENKWRDVLFIFFFVATLIGVFVVLGVNRTKSDNVLTVSSSGSVSSSSSVSKALSVLVGSMFAGWGTALVFLVLMRFHPVALIQFSLLVCPVLFIILAAVCFVRNNTGVGVFLLVVAAIGLLFAWIAQKKVKFTAALFVISMTALNKYKANFFISVFTLIMQIVWIIFWAWVVAESASKESSNGVFIYLLFAFYFICAVIKNVCHVTISGSVASYFFATGETNPTGKSFRRALTTSFGSICLGSLIIAVIQTIKAIVQSVTRSLESTAVAALLRCITKCIENLVNLFNKYAFTKVAIYGLSFVAAAKETWELLKTRGLDLVINDNIADAVLTVSALSSGIVSALIAFGWGIALRNSGDISNDVVVFLVLAAFILGLIVCITMLVPVDSAIATLFVCIADDPIQVQIVAPAFFGVLTGTYAQFTVVNYPTV